MMNASISTPIDLPDHGVTVNHDMKGLAVGKVLLEYRGRFVPLGMEKIEIECEVYEVGGVFSIHTACPKCRHVQWIDGRNKRVEYDVRKSTIYVEPFKCPWEMGGADDRHKFGLGLCQLLLVYDGKSAKDA
jgi:hypothetical protein